MTEICRTTKDIILVCVSYCWFLPSYPSQGQSLVISVPEGLQSFRCDILCDSQTNCFFYSCVDPLPLGRLRASRESWCEDTRSKRGTEQIPKGESSGGEHEQAPFDGNFYDEREALHFLPGSTIVKMMMRWFNSKAWTKPT